MEDLYEYLSNEFNAHFSGWDFSYLEGRMEEDKLPWNYQNIVEKACSGRNRLLDMDTGGGELLCSLSNLPKQVFATEGYKPNIPIAENRLKERGYYLKPVKASSEIPFEDEYFDIIINRHGSFDINILKRTLQKNGLFITQQVGGLNGIDMNMAFETKTMNYVEWCLIKNIEIFKNSGMEILDYEEYVGKMKFKDIGALVYYLKCIPWQVKDFSIEKYYNKLTIINDIIQKKDFIDFTMHRFYIVVRKL
ncbi:MAG: class I SAM-dependent methyltransferase [Oscillospiraceae bacterium]|nr:class I SAM-dependent methyltransferase [Oscillospiraceae bacterium]